MENVRKGMVVYSSDGERLGKVVAVRADTIVVEKGFFFPTDYTCRIADVSTLRGDDVVLRLSKDELESGISRQGRPGIQEGRTFGSQEVSGKEEVRVPVTEEELEVQKRGRKKGEVRVSKQVKTEEKQVTVPVTREEVHVERVPGRREASADDARFAQQDISVPVMEEEVTVNKRPVVREEVRISKESREEQRPISAQVRREVAEIEEEPESERSKGWTDDPSHP